MASAIKNIVAGSKVINKKVRKVRRRLPATPLYPASMEAMYRQELLAVTRYAREMVNTFLVPKLANLSRRYSEKQKVDAASDDLATIMETLRNLVKNKYTRTVAEAIASDVAAATSIFNAGQINRAYKTSVGIDPTFLKEPYIHDSLKSFSYLNSRLITSLPEKYLDDVQHTVFDAFTQGIRAEEVAKGLADDYDMSEKRAATVARDQIGKLNGELNELRLTELGSTSYEWVTMGDDRVRSSHEELNGQIFDWDGENQPPEDIGHPGMDFNCRCIASPIFPDGDTSETNFDPEADTGE